jgi:alpha-glucosidase (family GH31 glycosyl hydrolase)
MMRQGGGINQNSELFVRTNQFGAWGPIFTSWGNGGENNMWWQMPEPFASAMRGALLDRQRLLPLRYTLAAEAARTGLCPIRGMHFTAPLHPEAYATPGQYMLGADLIVAPAFGPVTPPIPPEGGVPGGAVGVSMWVPPGAWLDFNDPAASPMASGWIVYNASIGVVPVLVRGGAVVATLPRSYAPVWGVSAQNYDALVFTVFPGLQQGGTSVYEDDGASTDFLTGRTAATVFSYAPGGSSCSLMTIATRGEYEGMVTAGRAYTVELIASPAPARVAQNGRALPENAVEGVAGTWARRGQSTVVTLLPVNTGADVELSVCV